MRCPFCDHGKTRVIDSRPGGDNNHIRRRRQCPHCGRRFTTFERPGENFPLVIKRDGRLEEFDRNKMLAAVRQACTKLPVSEGDLTRLVGQIETRMHQSRRRKLRTQVLGDWVASALLELHPAAYIRYSMVHRHVQDFRDVQMLLDEELNQG
ncbi:MAG: transcriptional regulator NrdR [Syntrophobacteria bacterium]